MIADRIFLNNDMDGYRHEVDVRMSLKGTVNGMMSIHE